VPSEAGSGPVATSKHREQLFAKLGIENRASAPAGALQALVLRRSSPASINLKEN